MSNNFKGFDAINTQRLQTILNRDAMYNHPVEDFRLKKAKENDALEKGEGSRGGKVIGHTKSGKPIYDSFEHEGHKHFSHQDHKDAVKAHVDIAKEDVFHGLDHAGKHQEEAKKEDRKNQAEDIVKKDKEHFDYAANVREKHSGTMKKNGHHAYITERNGEYNHFFDKPGKHEIGKVRNDVSEADKKYSGKIVSEVKPH
jgi:hypothetical protein